MTVLTQPSAPSQTCTVTSGSGTVGSANVTSVAVTCATGSYTIGGTVTGLVGGGLVLQNNGGDNLTVSANGAFTFPTSVSSGASYAVTVLTQPGVADLHGRERDRHRRRAPTSPTSAWCAPARPTRSAGR